ncbi:MAG: GAF domain-containing sensor histidine kinase [Anaerolineales bacterium]|nr:GAF domain-containing sensor histidine kinase [Anaerolineales bacterium]
MPDTTAVCRATLLIAEAETVPQVLERAATAVQQLLPADGTLVACRLEAAAGLQAFGSGTLDTNAARDVAAELLATAHRAGEPFTWPAEAPHFVVAPVGEAGAPPFGVLAVAARQPDAVVQPLLQVLAAHTAAALHKSVLLQGRHERAEQLEARNRQMAVFSEAVKSIAGELALEKVLARIVEAARELVEAKYAALGVPDGDGMLTAFIHSGMSPQQVASIDHLPRGHGLLGAIIREKRPIRIPHIARDPRSVGFPEGHPPMVSFLGVPIIAAGDVLGNLYLTNKHGEPEFSQDDQRLIELLAAHAAVAIQNARLYEQVGRLVIVEERTRIGMDLHDGTIQSIYAVGLTLESTRLAILDGDYEEVDRLLDFAIEGLNNTIRDIRNFILDLRPHRFRGDLHEGLSRLVREFQANAMVAVELEAPPEMLVGLQAPLARALFLTTQEALANVARHARANQVHVRVQRTPSLIKLTIRDDGRGFDMRVQARTVGHGLSNMRARAEELQGSFAIDSAPGGGTKIVVSLPTANGR